MGPKLPEASGAFVRSFKGSFKGILWGSSSKGLGFGV